MTASPLGAAVFVLMALVLSAATHLLIWRCLLEPGLPPAWRPPAARVLACLSALLPIGMVQLLCMRLVPRSVASPLMWTVFCWVGITYFLLLGAVLASVLQRVLRREPAARRRLARGCTALALALALGATVQGLAAPEVVPIRVRGPAALAGYRVVQLSDLHIGPMLGRSFARDVVTAVNRLHADLIVVTGDLVDGSVSALAPEVEPLAELRARDGVFFVLGNHEYLSGADEWAAHLRSMGWRILRNERVALPRIDLVGLDDYAASELDPGAGPDLERALAGHILDRPSLLISHQPLAFKDACRAGADLALAGHTHGGQLAPLGLLAWLSQGYLAGLYRCGATHLYVSSGAGYWGPPMRLGSRAEISLLEFVER